MGRRIGRLTPEQLAKARCSKSPTKAHHWILDKSGRGTCKYCDRDAQFAVTFRAPSGNESAIRPSNPQNKLWVQGKGEERRH